MMNIEVLAFAWIVGKKHFLTGFAARGVVIYNIATLIVDTRPADGPFNCEVHGVLWPVINVFRPSSRSVS